MKNKLIGIQNSFLIMKRGVVESVIDLLKSICNLDHTRHRSPINAIVNIWAAIAAYSFFDHKPSIISSHNIALKFVS